jgi:hypothetical protein
MNKDGVIPADLGEVVELETKPVKVLDYENVVGQDSLTRLDERRNQNKKKSKNRNKNQRPGGQADGSNNVPRQEANAGQPQRPQPARPQEGRPEGGNPNKNKNFRPNRNNQNRPGNNRGDQPGKQE